MSLLLNKIPVLDKGFVATYDTGNNSVKLNALAVEHFKVLDGKFLADSSSLTLVIKCPLFMQLNLSQWGFRITPLPTQGDLEAYIPNVGEIGAKSLEESTNIEDDMKRTSAALFMNHKAYTYDGCNRFLSQILTPINTYTTILVHGMYNDWNRFVSQNNTPAPIASYVQAVASILKAEWP